jgi:hypothetical protein
LQKIFVQKENKQKKRMRTKEKKTNKVIEEKKNQTTKKEKHYISFAATILINK